MSVKEQRARFNQAVAPKIAASLGMHMPSSAKPDELAAVFQGDDRLVIVAPRLTDAKAQADVQKCLARGLAQAGERQLVLVMPRGHSHATATRSAWLDDAAKPQIHEHARGSIVGRVRIPTRDSTLGQLQSAHKKTNNQQDFLDSTTPLHLDKESGAVARLVEEATSDYRLDGSHRNSVRAWHCMGQAVLSIRKEKGKVAIRAGIHYSDAKAPKPHYVTKQEPLTDLDASRIWEKVEKGIASRLDGPRYSRDEAWLQAVIRRRPDLTGVEHPALREVPAWRPRDDAKMWSRGRIDLLGLDGHGNLRLVETKLEKNRDEMLVLQGLDYYVWATAYRELLDSRLGAPPAARLELHFVLGSAGPQVTKVHPNIEANARSLAPDIPWRFQVIRNWFKGPNDQRSATSELLDKRQVP